MIEDEIAQFYLSHCSAGYKNWNYEKESSKNSMEKENA